MQQHAIISYSHTYHGISLVVGNVLCYRYVCDTAQKKKKKKKKHVYQIQVLIIFHVFATPPIKLKLGFANKWDCRKLGDY
jgi:hypothetical protein